MARRQTRVSMSVSGAVGQRFRAHCEYTGQVRCRLLEELLVRYLDGLDGSPARQTTEQRVEAIERRLDGLEYRAIRARIIPGLSR
jgi:hypothetical protein